MSRSPFLTLLAALLPLAALTGCAEPPPPPNVLWIVWDTVRADHLGLYGYPRPTTPFLDAWARQARVFDDCVSPGTITLTSHGSLFTGLQPSEHGADNGRRRLDDRHVTFAEHLKASGYRTFLWSANPHISADANFDQGFDLSLHPWSERYRERARQVVRDKIADEDESSELPPRVVKPQAGKWDIKASGVLAREALAEWLAAATPDAAGGDAPAPYFAFLNYMEAHRPRIPPEKYRQRMMSADDIARSYRIDQSWDAIWSYSFGLSEYTTDELRIMTATYDAAIAELDELLRDLITSLEASGALDNTVVVLTSDHGEHLGEHHLLDHQYSVYDPLARVPLVLYDPRRITAGREARPVMSHDLFPTLLELSGVDLGANPPARGVSLLGPRDRRPRLTEYLTPFRTAFRSTAKLYPDWDSEPWNVELRALTLDRRKLIRGSNGSVELYDLEADPAESKNLAASAGADAERLGGVLDRQLAALTPWTGQDSQPPQFSPEHLRRLQALGYVESSGDAAAADPAAPVAGQPANIIFVVVDTLRADHLGFAGYSRPTSPHLDRLASESITFDSAYAQAPWTSPSVASLLTSRYPGTLGYADSKDPAKVEDDALLLAEILTEHGYRTHAVVSHTYAGSRLGFDQGMSTFDEDNALGPLHVSSPSVTDKAIALLDGVARDQPFFLFLHYFDPHFSYMLHEGYDFDPDYRGDVESGAPYGTLVQRARDQTLSERDVHHIRALYDSEIRFTDQHIGRLLEHLRKLGLYDDALIVFTADHGEAFLDRKDRWIGHGKTLFDELIRVPLTIKLPAGTSAGTLGASADIRVATPVGLVDVVPSLLDVLKLTAPGGAAFEGRVLPLNSPEALSRLAAEPVFAETMARQRWLQSVVDGRFKLIVNRQTGRYRLFDLETDPGERQNLAQTEPATARKLAGVLNAWNARIDAERREGARPNFSEEEIERLRALGYLP